MHSVMTKLCVELSIYGIQQNLSAKDLIEDKNTSRYLMYYPWESDQKIFVWQEPPEPSAPM